MKLRRVMIAAPKSGSGKTTITCGILQALKSMGESVVSYKCGPDYIDPMFHKTVLGITSKNLDTFFTNEEQTRELFLNGRKEEELAVMEGVMGLYDGLGGIHEEGSSYHLAKVTKTPIVLVIDGKGMARSIIPVLSGILAYDEAHLIQGVILNRVSNAMCGILKPLIEEELNLTVVGCFPEQKQFQIGSRHLGLLMPEEIADIQGQIAQVSKELVKTVSMERLLEIAGSAKPLETRQKISYIEEIQENRPILAVARDEAFCFYYEDNLRMLEEFGVKLVPFSPLRDRHLPEGCGGILLGGGYPELHLEELKQNHSIIEEIRREFEHRMPMVAECGGFMYLHEIIQKQEKESAPMVGILPGMCYNRGKLVRFGYIEIEDTKHCFLKEGEIIRAHEFHYFDSEDNGTDCIARKPSTGKTYPCIHTGDHFWFGFPHLYYPSNPSFAEQFARKVKEYRR